MGYHLAGWVTFTVEVQSIADDIDALHQFGRELHTNPAAMFLTLQPTAGGAEPLGAMVEGMTANSHYVTYAGPAIAVMPAMLYLTQLCEEKFPRNH